MNDGPTMDSNRKRESEDIQEASLPARPERAGFLQDLRREPEAQDLPLVYADWLEDHGEPERAEFIRVNCELAVLSEDDPGRGGLSARAKELFTTHGEEWLRPFAAVCETSFSRRGLVEHLYVTDLPAFLERAPDIMAREPIHSLDFQGPIGPEGARALAGSPHVAGLRTLVLPCHRLGPSGTRALVESPHLAALEDLDLGSNGIGDQGARALAAAAGLQTLRGLDLWANGITAEGARALARSPHLAGLTRLDLACNAIGASGARAFADSPHLRALKQLDLACADIGPAGGRALAESPHLGALERLGLAHNGTDDETKALLLRRFGDVRVSQLGGLL